MKVLLSVASLQPSYGGPAFSVSQLANALAAAGVEVGLWAPDGSAVISPLVQQKARLRVLKGDAREALETFGHPTVLHDNGIWLPHNHRLADLARKSGLARIVSTRGMLEPWAIRHKAVKKRLAWSLYQRRDLVRACVLHATADAEAKNLKRLALGPEIVVIPNGVAAVGEDACAREASGERIALFMGRIYPVKGLPMLMKAWVRARPTGWRLEIAGPDEAGHRAEVEAAIRAEHLGDVVRFLGPVDGEEKVQAFRRADLFVLPSHSESFGMAVGEALAYGLPVLTTHAVPWPALEEQGCGWRVEASVEALAAGLTQATKQDAHVLSAMGAKGRDLVASTYSWAATADAFLRLYEEVAA